MATDYRFSTLLLAVYKLTHHTDHLHCITIKPQAVEKHYGDHNK